MASRTTAKPKPDGKAKPPKIQVNSEEELNQVLVMLAKFKHHREHLIAKIDKKTQELAAEMAPQFHVEFEGERYHVHDLLSALEAAGVEWALDHRGELLADGKKKSKKLPNGTVSFGLKPNSGGYKFREGETPGGVLDRLAERFKLAEVFLNLLRSLRLRGKNAVTLDRVLSVECKVDLKRVQLFHENGELADDDLKEIGVEVKQPVERCTLKPSEFTVD